MDFKIQDFIYTGAQKIYGLLQAPRLNFHHLSYKEQANTFISR